MEVASYYHTSFCYQSRFNLACFAHFTTTCYHETRATSEIAGHTFLNATFGRLRIRSNLLTGLVWLAKLEFRLTYPCVFIELLTTSGTPSRTRAMKAIIDC